MVSVLNALKQLSVLEMNKPLLVLNSEENIPVFICAQYAVFLQFSCYIDSIKEAIHMAKVSTNISLDENLKKASQELYSDLGMDLSTAVTIFLKQSLRV